MAELTAAYRKDGPRGYWQKYLDLPQKRENSGGFTSLMFTAQIYTNLGNKDEALKLLEEQFEKDRYNKALLRLKGNPVWAPLRAEPRFKAILRRLGLPE